jgi:hypothetical protein
VAEFRVGSWSGGLIHADDGFKMVEISGVCTSIHFGFPTDNRSSNVQIEVQLFEENNSTAPAEGQDVRCSRIGNFT